MHDRLPTSQVVDEIEARQDHLLSQLDALEEATGRLIKEQTESSAALG